MSLYKGRRRRLRAHGHGSPAARHMVDQAMRIAMARRAVTAIILPNDVQDLPMEDPPAAHGAVFSGIGYRSPRWLPEDHDLTPPPTCSTPAKGRGAGWRGLQACRG